VGSRLITARYTHFITAGWPSKPSHAFFRDSQTLADRFGPEVHDHLIDRPEGLWRALAAAGVRDLSDAVETGIFQEEPAGTGGVVVERLKGRKRLIMRVLAADDVDASQKLSEFDEHVSLVRLRQLVIAQALDLGGVVHRTQPFDRGALYRSDMEALLYVETRQPPSWGELARELTRALKVDGFRAPDVAGTLRGVLAAETDDEARRDLDELGFRALDEANAAEAEPTVAGLITAVLLGIAVIACLWWSYFDWVVYVAQTVGVAPMPMFRSRRQCR
jgi:hypothetical protein